MEPAGEQPGVDRAGYRRVDGHAGDHGDAEHVVDVGGCQAATVLGHQDNAVDAGPKAGQQAGEGDVAGPPQHCVVLAGERVDLTRRRDAALPGPGLGKPTAVHDHVGVGVVVG